LSRRSRNISKGFTLIEIMIVVAIIGLLAAIAIPNYTKYTLRARQGESLTVLGMLKTAQFTHYVARDCFVPLEATPLAQTPGTNRMTWNSVVTGNGTLPCTNRVARSFEDILVRPNHGTVYYVYQCTARFPPVDGGTDDEFTCNAFGDLDGDTQIFEMIYGTDHDEDGQTIPSGRGTVSFFPNEPIRVSPGIF
jgi:prepilin-type N-terminal cleavage/methylation domain-containing protein